MFFFFQLQYNRFNACLRYLFCHQLLLLVVSVIGNSLAKNVYLLLVIWVSYRNAQKLENSVLIWNSFFFVLWHPFLDSFVCLFVVCRSWVRPDWLWFILFVSWCHLVLWQRFARSWKRENSLPFCILGDIPTFESDFGLVLLCVSCFGW